MPLLLALLLAGTSRSFAAPLYWDLNGDVAGSGSATPTGVWDLTTQNWNATATGDLTLPSVWANTGTDTAVFAAGTDATGSYEVTVNGALLLSGITLEEGGTLTLAQGTDGALGFGAVQAQINVATGATLISNVALSGTAGLAKSGAGTLYLNNASAPSGPYLVSSGTLAIGDGLSISGTTLNLGGVAGLSSTVTLGTGTVYHLAGAINFLNANTPLAALIQGGTITLNGTRNFSAQNISALIDLEIRSVIADGTASSGVNKTSAGTILLSGSNTYTGVTNVTVGTLQISGGGSITSSSAVTVAAGTTLTFGSNTDTVAVNRVGDAAIITLTAGGNNDVTNLNFNGSDFTTQTVQVETVGGLVIAGQARSFVSLKAGAGDEYELRLGSLTRSGSALGLIRADGLGQSAGTAGAVRVYVSEPLALFGTAGAILPWLVGDVSTTGTGTGFLTYDSTNGLRLLNSSEYTVVAANSLTAGVNAVKSGGAVTLSSSVRVNSWTNSNTGAVTLGAAVTLGIDSGGLLFTANGTFTAGVVDLASYTQGIVHVASDSNITATINSVLAGDSGVLYNGTGSGTKILALGGNNTFTGGLTVMNGTVELRSAGGLNTTGVNSLNMLGGTLRLNGNSVTVSSLDGVGTVINNSATLNTPSTLTVNGGGTFTGSLNNGSTEALALTKKGSAALVLGGANTYTGETIVEEGILHVNQQGNAPGTNGSLANTSGITVKQGGTFRINNGNATNNSGNRVNDAATLTLAGGTFFYGIGGNNAIAYSETIGALHLQAGSNTITTQASDGTSTFTFASFGTRAAGATVNFTGGSLGTAQNKLVFTSGVADGFLGGWATNGNEFVKYVTGTGIIAMSGSDYLTTAATGWTSAVHAKPSADQTLSTSYDVASLNLAAGIDVNLGTNTLATVSGGLIKSGGTVDGTGTSVSNITGTGKLTAGNTTAAAELFVRVTGANLIVSAVVGDNAAGGAVSLVKAGAGTLDLKSANSYTGSTYFNEGTILISHADALGVGGSLVFNGGKLKYADAAKTFDASTRSTLFLGDAIFDTQTFTVTFANAIGGGGSGRFIKMGSGVLNLSSTTNALNYGGTTRVTEGTLRFTGTGAVHGVNGLILGGTTVKAVLDVGAGNLLNLNGNIAAFADGKDTAALIQNGTMALNGSRTVDVALSAATEATNILEVTSTITNGTVSGSRLTKTGAGTLKLLSDNGYTGRTEIWDGKLVVTDLEALGITTGDENALVLGNAATTGAFSYEGTENVSSNRKLLLNGETGGGVLLAEKTGALDWSGQVTISQTGTKTLTLGGAAAASVQNQVSGVISDNLAVQATVNVVKTGTATWRLTGQNTYRGTTTVQQGVLQVGSGGDGSSLSQALTAGTTGTGRTTVTTGGVVSGTGVIKTGLTLQGGEVRPGDSVLAGADTSFDAGGKLGTLWVNGDVLFESGTLTFQVQAATVHVAALTDSASEGYAAALSGLGADYAADLSAAVNQSGFQHDHLEITGSFTATTSGTKSIVIVPTEGATFAAGDVFNLVDWNGLAAFSSATPTFVLPQLSDSSLMWDASLFSSQGIVFVTLAPEPSRGVLLVATLSMLVLRRRRPRQAQSV
ncbi:autotransporter-associated beta strand repeat-containing protein [Verrucomicrobium sp. BvORR034]|uniref:beta strand repeat-containing protein n=1 Tax=Verrucomicrobium sp. BvORR034 TaxID=1396418 RepID=UPI000B0108BA|nr:autotransporter-associated beta strand repeat-containing protein [Verrucomicrobium sp. BvORR034]